MRFLLGILAVLILACLGFAAWIYSGSYDASAAAKDPKAVRWLTETARRQSVQIHSADIKAPSLADPVLVEEGARTFANNCALCHGAPGAEPAPFSRGMQPTPPNLADEVGHWTSAELFWIVRNGLRMTGMPAWEGMLVDGEIWGVVAFLEQLPSMPAERFQQIVAPPPPPPPAPAEQEQVIPPPEGEEPVQSSPPEPDEEARPQ